MSTMGGWQDTWDSDCYAIFRSPVMCCMGKLRTEARVPGVLYDE